MLFALLISLISSAPLWAISAEISSGQPGRLRLLKLLDVQLDKRFDNIVRNIEDNVYPEAESDFGVSETNENATISVDYTSCGCKESKQILAVLDELKSNIKHLEYTTSSNLGEVCYPIGVSKYRSCRRGHPLNERRNSNEPIPTTCKQILDKGNKISGVYQIQPATANKPFLVLCDMETEGGGWTHIQKRVDGFEDFYLGWREYKHGFGDLAGEFWIGLENIYKMTASSSTELLVELVDDKNKTSYAHYTSFKIASENEGYRIEDVNGHSGDLYDAMTYHVDANFTTKDFDQDVGDDNCATYHQTGGWWFKNCYQSSLNGKYTNVNLPSNITNSGIRWKTLSGDFKNYGKSRMLLRSV